MDENPELNDENAPLPSTSAITTVKMLPRAVSTQICTSQVIISAAGAVRQLLDNAMDAGARNIEVSTLNFGTDSIRVTDDGSGIDVENFESLCKRHATSKITEYDDLLALSTLGFRGEALNALCALGCVTITTRTASEEVGTRLHFDHTGVIERRETVPREVGTTVEARTLFTTLPVRRKEFERTAKREYAKLVAVVQEFALASPSIRFNVFSELTSNSKRHSVLSTAGGESSLAEVITNLFGGGISKNEVVEIRTSVTAEDAAAEGAELQQLQPDAELQKEIRQIQLDGFVSSPLHGNGRLVSDRQFVYVNGRPVDYPKVCRAVNEIYQMHNRRQYPTLVLRIRMPADWVDVNVTPDKRLVFCQKERALVHVIRETINTAFKPFENLMATLEKNSAVKKEVFSQSFASSPVVKSPEKSNKRKRVSIDSEAGGPDSSMLSGCSSSEMDETQRMNSVLEGLHSNEWGLGGARKAAGGPTRPRLIYHTANEGQPVSGGCRPDTVSEEGGGRGDTVASSMEGEESATSLEPVGFRSREMCQPQVKKARGTPSASSMGMRTLHSFAFKITPYTGGGEGGAERRDDDENRMDMDARRRILNRSYDEEREREMELIGRGDTEEEAAIRRVEGALVPKEEIFSQQPIKREVRSQEPAYGEESEAGAEDKGVVSQPTASRKEQKMNCSMAAILRLREAAREANGEEEGETGAEEEEGLEELREGPSTANEAAAEEQLRRAIRKSDFAEMEVVGQFNSGFIITKLNGHLFIVDQHASDEKANFEKFQKSAVVKNQETIRPQRLDVGAVAEAVVKDNIGVFNASGFHFAFPEDGSGAQLLSLPVVHGASFDRKDIDELISSLTINPGVMIRPSKLNKVFASKACRSSVMIGARLTREKMRSIVAQLGRLDHPWSCPHGRPTLRHLANLKKIEDY